VRRLDTFVRAVEARCSPQADFEAIVSHERAISRDLGGRTVFDDRPKKPTQPRLF